MCDTLVATGEVTRDGNLLFAKNSDREPNEAQEIVLIPEMEHSEGEEVECTYISIPQVRKTHPVLLSKPFWIWGAEMGTNDCGVVIGNEALFTRVKQPKEPALIGMDYLRLALERAATAREAVEVITTLLAEYGQAGDCGFSHPFTYDNSYLIADAANAWVLETAGREWAALQVHGIGSISNAITIDREWDLASPGLVDFAVDQKWCKNRADFSFKKCYTDPWITRFADSDKRQHCTCSAMEAERGQLALESMIAILRSHTGDPQKGWSPDRQVSGNDVCMHYGFGPIRINQTTGSMVSELSPDHPLHFMTGTAAPCTSVFKPVWVDLPDLDTGPEPGKFFDENTLWWRHEMLHRHVLRDYSNRLGRYRAERDSLESEFIDGARGLSAAEGGTRSQFVQDCFQRADEATARWTKIIQAMYIQNPMKFNTKFAWQKAGFEAHFPK